MNERYACSLRGWSVSLRQRSKNSSSLSSRRRCCWKELARGPSFSRRPTLCVGREWAVRRTEQHKGALFSCLINEKAREVPRENGTGSPGAGCISVCSDKHLYGRETGSCTQPARSSGVNRKWLRVSLPLRSSKVIDRRAC